MDSSPDLIYEAALKLPIDERLALLTRLMDSVPVEDTTMSIDDPNLLAELERRVSDPSGAVPWSELRNEQ